MVVWSGKGILSVLVFLSVLFFCMFILDQAYVSFGFGLAFLVAGIFSYFFGLKWNREIHNVYIDEITNERVAVRKLHSLFWIKLEYWGLIFTFLSIVVLFQNFSTFGIQFFLTVFLFIVAIFCLMLFSYKLFQNFSKKNQLKNDNLSQKRAIEENPKFVKEKMKREQESDHSKYLPK